MPFYLLDRATSQIKASYSRLTGVSVQGFRVVDVPDDLSIDESVVPFDSDELRDQKFAALLALAPRYTNIFFDELDTAGVWDLTDPDIMGGVGVYRAFLAAYDPVGAQNGRLQTDTIDVSADGLFEDFAVYWDLYTLTRTGTRTSEVVYQRVEPDLVDVFVSNDDGATYTQVTHLTPELLAGSGNQLRVRFENSTPGQRYYIGSLALLY